MKTQDQLTENDLSITFDQTGRMWKFRPTKAPTAASRSTRTSPPARSSSRSRVPGLKSGDVDLSVNDDVLHVRGRSDRHHAPGLPTSACRAASTLTCSRPLTPATCSTIRVPLIAPRAVETTLETIAVAV